MSIETMKQVIEKLKVAMTDARQDESHFESWMILNEAICNSIDDLRAAIEQAEKREWQGLTDEEANELIQKWAGELVFEVTQTLKRKNYDKS